MTRRGHVLEGINFVDELMGIDVDGDDVASPAVPAGCQQGPTSPTRPSHLRTASGLVRPPRSSSGSPSPKANTKRRASKY